MSVSDLIGVAYAASVGIALFVLPGLGVREFCRLPRRQPLDELLIGVATGTITVAAIGTLLVGTRAFSPWTLALPLIVLAVAGVRRTIYVVLRVLPSSVSLVLAVLSVPWWWSAARAGAPPSPLFQWYYWDLGRAVGGTNGIPQFVSEYGTHIRWLPDYFVFNLHSEVYRGLTSFAGRTNPIVAFRIPIALLAIVAVFGVLRMWLPPWAALLGTAFTIESAWFLDKFNAYKPEAFGIIIGLIAVRLGIRALRARDPSLLVFVGVLLGVDLAIHAIAATVTGLLLAGALVAELIATRELRVRRTTSSLVIAAVLALAVSGAIGWSVQGRVSVIGDATNPQRLKDGTDPTLVFAARDAGNFGRVTEPSVGDELSTYISEPWPGLRLDTGTGVAFGGFVVVGFTLAFAAGGGLRKAVLALTAFALLLVLGIAYFSICFDTYVPRHTGLARFAQYAPLVMSFAAAVSLAAIARTLTSIPIPRPARARRRVGAIVGVIVVAVTTFGATRAVIRAYRPQLSLSAAAQHLLDGLDHDVKPGEGLIANSGTRGLIEFWTHAEVPLEARQALIEAPDFVSRATRTLEDAHAFFTGTGAPQFADHMRANWIVVNPTPDRIGAAISLGIPPAGWTVPGFSPVLGTTDATVLHRDQPAARVTAIGPAKNRAVAAWIAVGFSSVLIIAALLLLAPGLRARVRARSRWNRGATNRGAARSGR